MRNENEIKEFMQHVFGIDPEDIDVKVISASGPHGTYNPLESISKMMENAKTAAENVRDDVSADAMRNYLLRSGFSEDRVNDLIQELEANKRKAAEMKKAEREEAKTVNNNVVEMTLQSIAAAFGYNIKGAVIRNGVPVVGLIKRKLPETNAPTVVFDKIGKFKVIPCKSEAMEPYEAENYIELFEEAVNMCKALNQIDCRTWPSVD